MRNFTYILFGLLCACTSEPLKPPATICAPQAVATSRFDALMQYYAGLKKLSPPELAREHQNMTLEFSKTKSDASRMKLALLLWLPDTPFRDPSASLQLLDSRQQREDSGLESFAALFAAMLSEQAASANSMLQLEAQLKTEKKLSSDLRKKIDAIKKMEKNMIRMEKP